MNARDFEIFLHYDAWANRRLIETCGSFPGGAVPPEIADLLRQGLVQGRLWLTRLTGEEQPEVLQSATPADWRRAYAEFDGRFQAFIKSLVPIDMSRTVSFAEANRMPFHLSLPMAVSHVVFLQASLRENIILAMRQAGVVPPACDFMSFALESGVMRP